MKQVVSSRRGFKGSFSLLTMIIIVLPVVSQEYKSVYFDSFIVDLHDWSLMEKEESLLSLSWKENISRSRRE
jgi:hypothetical protein